MIKVTLITDNPRITDIVPKTMTIREFLNKHGVNYAVSTTAVDGVTLPTGGMDMSFADHNLDKQCIVTCLPNKDSGAVQATILGSSCVIKTALAPDDIKRVKKFHPEALVMDDEDGDPVFAIDIDEEGPGSINEYGARFGNSVSSDGKATITVLLDPTAEDTESLVYEQIGSALRYLKEMEEHVVSILPELEAEEQETRSMITRL